MEHTHTHNGAITSLAAIHHSIVPVLDLEVRIIVSFFLCLPFLEYRTNINP